MGLSVERTQWLEGLKVVQLKDELKSRGINANGVKAALMERLREALHKEASVADEPAATSIAEDTAGAAPQAAAEAPAAAPAEAQQDEQAPALPAMDPASVSPQLQPAAPPQAPTASTRPAEPASADAPAAAPKQQDSELARVPPVFSTDAVDQEEQVDYGQDEPEPDVPPATQVPAPEVQAAAQRPGTHNAGDVATATAEPKPASVPTQPASAPAVNVQTPAPDGKHKRTPIPSFQAKSKSQAAAPAAPAGKAALPAAQADPAGPLQVDASGAAAEKPSSLPDASAAALPAAGSGTAGQGPGLRITNLVRPFTDTQLKGLISQSGGVVDLWMPGIKTHAVVLMQSAEQAAACATALQGLQWPAGSPKRLSVSILAHADAVAGIKLGRSVGHDQPPAPAPAKPTPSPRTRTAPIVAAEMAVAPQPADAAPGAEEAGAAAAAAAGTDAAHVISSAAPVAGEEATAAGDVATGSGTQPSSTAAAGATPSGTGAPLAMGAVAARKAAMAAARDAALLNGSGHRPGTLGHDSGGVGNGHEPPSKRLAGVDGAGRPAVADDPMQEEVVPTLDMLFKKTQAKPSLYWLPLTDAEVVDKKRREAAEEHLKAMQVSMPPAGGPMGMRPLGSMGMGPGSMRRMSPPRGMYDGRDSGWRGRR